MSGYTVTRQRLRAMMKHLEKKGKVNLVKIFQCSVPDYNDERVYGGKIVEWSVKTVCYDGKVPYEYEVWARFADGSEMDESVPADAWFDGLCNVTWINSGPYCRFYGEWT